MTRSSQRIESPRNPERFTNTSATRYQGSGNYIWNNDKDTATLRQATGAKIRDTCSYNSTKADYKMC
jgi:hypothetical protein